MTAGRLSIRSVVLALVSTLVVLSAPSLAGAQGGGPKIMWEPCGTGDAECATVKVPADYDKPNGKTLKIDVARDPADDAQNRIGPLFFNFGGPGAPAAAYVEQFGAAALFPDLADRFDVIGVDPRGTGDRGIDCEAQQEKLGVYAQPFFTPQNIDRKKLVRGDVRYISRCLDRNRGIEFDLNSTANTARDMDYVREGIGERKLNYLGYSYGTFLGATYASLFPKNYRTLVLDGALDARRYINEPLRALRDQTSGFERAMGRFLAACAANQVACSGFGGGDPSTAFDRLIAKADANPIPADQGRPVDGDDIRGASAQLLYSKALWGDLGAALAQADEGDGTLMRDATDLFYGREDDGTYDPLLDRYYSIGAAEQAYPARLGPFLEAGEDSWNLFDHFYWNHGYTELAWGAFPFDAEDAYYGPFDVKRSSQTALVVGTTYDPATTYRGSKRLVDDLGNAELLTMEGDGHTAYGGNSQCIDDAVNAYFEDGTLPPEGTVCEQEVPFLPPVPDPPRASSALESATSSDLPTLGPNLKPLIGR